MAKHKKHKKKGKSYYKRKFKRVMKQLKLLHFKQKMKLGTSVWPPEYRTIMTTYVTSVQNPTSAGQQWSFFGNSFGDGTQAVNGVGAAVNGVFPFTKNYPAGLKGLIQTPASNGSAICPYTQYRIVKSRIYVRLVPAALGGSVQPATEIRIAIFPSTQLNYTGTQFTALVEQDYTKFKVINPGYFGTSTTTAISGGGQPLAETPSKWMTHSMSTAKIFGLPNNIIQEDNTFWCDYGSVAIANQPAKQWYWHVFTQGDGTNQYAYDLEVVVKHDTIFFNRNFNMSSAQNN